MFGEPVQGPTIHSRHRAAEGLPVVLAPAKTVLERSRTMSGFTEADVSDQSGKCFIVTGANTGVGFEASRVLAARGARVLLACRDKAKAEAAMARIGRSTPGAEPSCRSTRRILAA